MVLTITGVTTVSLPSATIKSILVRPPSDDFLLSCFPESPPPFTSYLPRFAFRQAIQASKSFSSDTASTSADMRTSCRDAQP